MNNLKIVPLSLGFKITGNDFPEIKFATALEAKLVVDLLHKGVDLARACRLAHIESYSY
ncbi:hypothetical protein L0B53_18370 (plasmid) [Vibrio sp. SS-MA-C1-2]|uniref:hypothetical protein n=1 Tax=Vibrio sp. SS-MA-C1-2 TaxID=2908646 RepID=UPI001F1F2DB6|nr:hypothetical protein [Vibrio sp. SS-MA-C1-2]UJF20298.1 hypothetical protein L0B53_18370 [Vibrio sp. SS-MA-C1-2]